MNKRLKIIALIVLAAIVCLSIHIIFKSIVVYKSKNNSKLKIANSNDLMPKTNLEGNLIEDKFGNIYKILTEFERDGKYFTEGFSYISEDKLLESCGFYNEASINYIKLDRKNKKALKTNSLSNNGNYFGEGSDIFLSKDFQRKIFQLTWTGGKIFQYDLDLKKTERTIQMPSSIPAGWAMTHNWDDESIAYIDTGDEHIYITDSTKDFKLIKKVAVFDEIPSKIVSNINEQEYIDGKLWMNVFLTNYIYKVDISTGRVENKFDFDVLHKRAQWLFTQQYNASFEGNDVFNGIAYDRERKTFYVTGKNWNIIFEIQIIKEGNE